jgi:hypothetical protein
VEEGEGSCCAGDPNEGEREDGGAGGLGARGAQAGAAELGWAKLGWAEPLRGLKTRRTLNLRQRNVLRHDATPMTLRFWFIHDTDTCRYTGLKLGRMSKRGKRRESNARIW